MTGEGHFYLAIPLAIHFTDNFSRWRVFHFASDSMKFPAIKRLGVKRHRRVVAGLGARDVHFST